jgi:chromosome partitioning protein
MTSVILIGGQKGGTGKSTIATNLAAYRIQQVSHNNMLLIDADSQGSTSEWAYWRREGGLEGIECIRLYGKNILSEIESKKKRYSDIIIDAGGRDSKELRYSMIVANQMLIPLGPSQHDLNTVPDIVDIIQEVRTVNPELQCYGFINKLKNNAHISDGEQTKAFMETYESIQTLTPVIHDRISFTRSAAEGRGVSEMRRKNGTFVDPKAVNELHQIYEVVYATQTT